MRLTIPLTGTAIKNLDGSWSGHPQDHVRVIELDLGDISWKTVSIDWDKGLMEVEASGTPEALALAQKLLADTPENHYRKSGSSPLKRVL
jgi:hypothetical protein